jgi:hypothetical protein
VRSLTLPFTDGLSYIQKPTRTIVEAKSDIQKILALQKRIAELKRIVGQK